MARAGTHSDEDFESRRSSLQSRTSSQWTFELGPGEGSSRVLRRPSLQSRTSSQWTFESLGSDEIFPGKNLPDGIVDSDLPETAALDEDDEDDEDPPDHPLDEALGG